MNKALLGKAILAVISAIVLLSFTHYATCKYWENPRMFRLYERSGGKLPDQEHQTCRDVGAKTLATLTGVLATLLALHSEPPDR